MKIFVHLLAWFLAAGTACAQDTLFSLNSATDGNGLFTYTFSVGNSPYTWGFDTNSVIEIPSHNIISVTGPANWTETIDASDYVIWKPTTAAGVTYLDTTTLTFSILSSSTVSVPYAGVVYQDLYPQGFISSEAYSILGHVATAGGYNTFPLVGPQFVPVPEPSVVALLGTALLPLLFKFLLFRHKSRRRRLIIPHPVP